ncbi:MAG: hypothetical protein LBK58_04995 [Prevotellaceae bacterium]|jgi:hypothetical protein|nr:hypothetical protein [Prevotellaceae bacterium]
MNDWEKELAELNGEKVRMTVGDLTLGWQVLKTYHDDNNELLRIDNLTVIALLCLNPLEAPSTIRITLLWRDGRVSPHKFLGNSTKIADDIYLELDVYIEEHKKQISNVNRQ